MTPAPPPGVAWLFCPADRPDRFAKAAERADAVILDLEDAVAPDAKEGARGFVSGGGLDPGRTIVRVNPRAGGQQEADLAAVRAGGYRWVMVPKAESGADLSACAGLGIIPLCETPAGVLAAPDLAREVGVVAMSWGGEDLIAALGGTSSRDETGGFRDVARQARTHVLLAAGAAGVVAVETVFLDLADAAGVAAMAADARACGFGAMMCIHPAQVPLVRQEFAPSPEQLEWARAVLAAAAASPRGVFSFRGRMVDEPVLRHARRIAGGDHD